MKALKKRKEKSTKWNSPNPKGEIYRLRLGSMMRWEGVTHATQSHNLGVLGHYIWSNMDDGHGALHLFFNV